MTYDEIKKKHLNSNTGSSVSSGATSGNAGGSAYENIRKKYVQRSNADSTTTIDQNYIDNFISASNKFNSDALAASKKIGYSNASSYLEEYKKRLTDLRNKKDQIKGYLYDNKDSLDENTYREYLKSLDDTLAAHQDTVQWFADQVGTMRNFKDEAEYNRHMKYAGKDYDGLKNMLSDLEKDSEEYEFAKKYIPSAVRNSKDFEHYSKLGTSASNPNWKDAQTPWNILGWKPFGEGEDIKNIVKFAEENEEEAAIDALSTMNGGGYDSEHTELVNLINHHMTDDEKAIYNYLIGRGEFEQANEYMAQVADVLRQRAAGRIVEHIDGTPLELISSGAAGLEQFGTGIKNLGNFITGDEAPPTGPSPGSDNRSRKSDPAQSLPRKNPSDHTDRS